MNWKRLVFGVGVMIGAGWVLSTVLPDNDYKYDVPDDPIEVEVDSDFECREEECSDSFDSERGRNIHEGRMH